MDVGCLTSRDIGAPPHWTRGFGTVQYANGSCRFMAAWVRVEEKTSEHRQGKREAEEANKFEVAPDRSKLETF